MKSGEDCTELSTVRRKVATTCCHIHTLDIELLDMAVGKKTTCLSTVARFRVTVPPTTAHAGISESNAIEIPRTFEVR